MESPNPPADPHARPPSSWIEEAAYRAALRPQRDRDMRALLPGMVRPGRFRPIKVVEVDLDHAQAELSGLDGYIAILALVRWEGRVIGYARAPVETGRVRARALREAIADGLGEGLLAHVLDRHLRAGLGRRGKKDEANVPLPSFSVVVCTRDRSEALNTCLESLRGLDYPDYEIVVVDNAPGDDRARALIAQKWPDVRYVAEQLPGLNWARNRGLAEARADFVAFTDDDVAVDSGWLRAFAAAFSEGEDVAAATGLVVPFELETEAQVLFERHGGFGRGFSPRWVRSGTGNAGRSHVGSGDFGTGANMAYRKSVLEKLGGFDPALDVGTPTHGGGDLEMFFRVVEEGHTLVYEPNAVVRHRHRSDHDALVLQARNNGIGFYSFAVRSAYAYPERLRSFTWVATWYLKFNLKRLLRSLVRPSRIPRSIVLAELRGSLTGLLAYRKSRARAGELAIATGHGLPPLKRRRGYSRALNAGTITTIDLNAPVQLVPESEGFENTRVYALDGERLLGYADIFNAGRQISSRQLRTALIHAIPVRLAETIWGTPGRQPRETEPSLLGDQSPTLSTNGLPADVSVSIVLATLDRPDDLKESLECLRALDTERRVEIIVVDNNPSSGLTPPVTMGDPRVKLVREEQRGLSYARNAGIAAATGDIIVMTDDDVRMPPQWLEKLVAPFARGDVVAVTGNVLPLEMNSAAQRYFEAYGGLGRGFKRREYDGYWFDRAKGAVKTWLVGATANAAFRASIFDDPDIGPMACSLGPGTPAGVGEDTYLFYKILKVGHTIVYEPDAFVWHRHRPEMVALRKQMFDYSKGHVAYHLTTLARDHDLRALGYLGWGIPHRYYWRLKRRLRGRAPYPLEIELIELAGNLAGPVAYWKAIRRARPEAGGG